MWEMCEWNAIAVLSAVTQIRLPFGRQLCGEVASLGSELSLARGEGQRNEAALEEVGRGRAELARDKAALLVQLTASERENAALSEEVTASRCSLICDFVFYHFSMYWFIFNFFFVSFHLHLNLLLL